MSIELLPVKNETAVVLPGKGDSKKPGKDQDVGRPIKETSNEKIKEINPMDNLDDIKQTSEIIPRDCELLSSEYKNGLSSKSDDLCELLMEKLRDMNNEIHELQKELLETKQTQSQLVQQNMEQECCNLRDQLRRKEEQYRSEAQEKQQLESKLSAVDMELRMLRSNLTKVSDSNEREKRLLHKNHTLQDEVLMLKQEINKMKNQDKEKEKKHFEDIKIIKEKNDFLEKQIRENEETFSETIPKHSEQLLLVKCENNVLNTQLENEKQNKERLEAEVESYRCRLHAALQDYEKIQMSKRDLELNFQRTREEWSLLQRTVESHVSALIGHKNFLCEEVSRNRSKIDSLETELKKTKDALREKTLSLEAVQRDLNQKQLQEEAVQCLYRDEQSKVKDYIRKQESLEESVSKLQREKMLLQQQLNDAYHKADNKEKTRMNIEGQLQDTVRRLRAESEKQEKNNNDLIDKCNHFKERIDQYEREKAAREEVVRKLQEELSALQKQSTSKLEASLKLLSEDKAAYSKALNEIRQKSQDLEDRYTQAVRCIKKIQDHSQKIETEKAKLKSIINEQACKIEHLQQNLKRVNLNKDTSEPFCKISLITSSKEEKELVRTSNKPAVKLLYNRRNNRYPYSSNSDDKLLKNLELFDQLSLQFNGRILFIKDVTGNEVCCWSFYAHGCKIAKVCCVPVTCTSGRNETKVEFPETGIYEEIRNILRFEPRDGRGPDNALPEATGGAAGCSPHLDEAHGGEVQDLLHQ